MQSSPDIVRCRVSHIDCFRAWLEDEDAEMGWLIQQLTASQPTEAMLKGTAFHKALEIAAAGEVDTIAQDGYTFIFDGNFEIAIPEMREIRRAKSYSGIEVSGQVDCLQANLIIDYKTSGSFDAERYYRKFQWRFYLDIFKASRFRWHVFEMRQEEQDGVKLPVYRVKALHTLEQCRYPEIEQDCRAMAMRFRDFCLQQGITPGMPEAPRVVIDDHPDGPLFGPDGDLLPATRIPESRLKAKFPMESERKRA